MRASGAYQAGKALVPFAKNERRTYPWDVATQGLESMYRGRFFNMVLLSTWYAPEARKRLVMVLYVLKGVRQKAR